MQLLLDCTLQGNTRQSALVECSAVHGSIVLTNPPSIGEICRYTMIVCVMLHYLCDTLYSVLYITARHCTAIKCNKMHCPALHCSVLDCTDVYLIMLHFTV